MLKLRMRIAIAQLNQVLGDLPATPPRSWTPPAQGRAAGARLVVTPELSLCGYPPEDLLLRPAFLDACARELARAGGCRCTARRVLVGLPGAARRPALQRARRLARRARRRRSIASSACRITRCSTRSAISSPATRLCVRRRRACAVGVDHLRGRLVSRTRARRRAMPARSVLLVRQWLAVPHAQQALRRDAGDARARRDRLAARLRQSGRRPGRAGVRRRVVRAWTRDGARRAAAAGLARGHRARRHSTGAADGRCAARSIRGSKPHVYEALVHGRARLRRQEPLSRRAARAVGRHRFGADAGGRRRCAGPRHGARA